MQGVGGQEGGREGARNGALGWGMGPLRPLTGRPLLSYRYLQPLTIWLSSLGTTVSARPCSLPTVLRVPNLLPLRSCDGLVDSADPDCAARK